MGVGRKPSWQSAKTLPVVTVIYGFRRIHGEELSQFGSFGHDFSDFAKMTG